MSDLDARLKKIKQDYKNTLPFRISEISSDWSHFRTDWSPDSLGKLIRDFHTLIGSSGTFGFHDVSRTAREIEVKLKKLLITENYSKKENASFVNEISLEIIHLIGVVSALNEKAVDNIHSNMMEHKSPHPIGTAQDYLIYYLDGDLVGAQQLTKQLIAYGFKCKHFREKVDLLNAIGASHPNLVILDLIVADTSVTTMFELAKSIVNLGPKVFMLSGFNDFENHLSAVRAGVHAYIEKPADVAFIVSKIRTVLQLHGNRPSKILIVDDQRSVAEFYASVLRDSGMSVQVEITPSDVLYVMSETMPDLVLLDLNMPDVSGQELAAIIRQQEQFHSIPIVFLTAEEIQQKSSLLALGTDVLLKHEISTEEFVLHIKSRVNRAKTLASKMYKDSLTGLLNHAQAQRSLEKEFLRSRRHTIPLSVVMIDIDKFKNVNDTYGHLVGDKVILALSNLLDQRLRSTDYIGRFGGEEFLVVMPNCILDHAGTIINKLRIVFSELKFEANGETFSVSFSAGISGIEESLTALDQLKRADDALYQAKMRGRNLVCANYESRKQA